MDPLDALRRRFRHHAWGGARLAGALAETPAPDGLRAFAHALAADRVWHHRLTGQSTDGLPIWPDLDADACLALYRATTADWRRYLADLRDPDAEIVYRNSRGEPFESRIADVLEHVLLHAAHHRGQANAALRRAGAAPPALDLILWTRTGEPAP